MKNTIIAGITLLLMFSCGGLDNNPYDARSPNYVGGGRDSIVVYVRDTLRIRDTVTVRTLDTVKVTVPPSIKESSPSITFIYVREVDETADELEVEYFLDKCELFTIRYYNSNKNTYETYEESRTNGVAHHYMEVPKEPHDDLFFVIDAQCTSPDTSKWSKKSIVNIRGR